MKPSSRTRNSTYRAAGAVAAGRQVCFAAEPSSRPGQRDRLAAGRGERRPCRRSTGSPNSRQGFTLVELLVVIAIIGVLVALLLPAVQAAREAARRSQCMNNIRQVGLGFQNYHSAKNHFPAGWMEDYNSDRALRAPHLLWGAIILPYIEQAPLHSQFDFKKRATDGTPGGAVENIDLIGTELANYRCPSDVQEAGFIQVAGLGSFYPDIPKLAISNYVGSGSSAMLCSYGQVPDKASPGGADVDAFVRELPNRTPLVRLTRQNGALYRNSETNTSAIVDGTTNTYIVGERVFGPWIDPGTETEYTSQAFWAATPGPVSYQLACYASLAIAATRFDNALHSPMINGHVYGFSSKHPGGVQVGMCDGAGRFINETIDEYTAEYLVRINDEQTLGEY